MMQDITKFFKLHQKVFARIILITLLAAVSFFYQINSIAAVAQKINQPYPAPQFTEISTWLNSKPLNLNDLKGKVILIDFWSYKCPNCIHSLPYVTNWFKKYSQQGFVVIGVHVPLKQNKNIDMVKNALKEYKIDYPIAVDNNLATAKSFHTHQLPSFYLINKDGQVVYTSVGRGNYATIERNLRALLTDNKQKQ